MAKMQLSNQMLLLIVFIFVIAKRQQAQALPDIIKIGKNFAMQMKEGRARYQNTDSRIRDAKSSYLGMESHRKPLIDYHL